MKIKICQECGSNFVPYSREQDSLSLCHNCLSYSQRCKAINRNGFRCRSGSSIDGYCMTHWKSLRDRNGLERGDRK